MLAAWLVRHHGLSVGEAMEQVIGVPGTNREFFRGKEAKVEAMLPK